MSWGHGNIAAIGTSKLNAHAGVNFKESYKLGDIHSEIPILKQNLREYRQIVEQYLDDFQGVPSLGGNTSQTFDNTTDANLKIFQRLEGVTQDGIYGQSSRNKMMNIIGISPVGLVRLSPYSSNYTNYNDTSAGMSGDSVYKLDHSWLYLSAKTTIEQLALNFRQSTGKKLEVNDCCLIGLEDTPEHSSHMDGKDADIRNANLTTAQQKIFLQLCVDNPGVSAVLYYTKHGINSNKIIVRADHSDHFHVDLA